MEYGIGLLGTGRYVPTKQITNPILEDWTGMPAKDILNRTGIETRYVALDDETASAMAVAAARQALAGAKIDAAQIGLIIVGSFTEDYVYSALACKVQDMLNAKKIQGLLMSWPIAWDSKWN